MRARGTVAVIGGSRGIGLAIASEFAARGHDLVLVARDAARLDEAKAELVRRHESNVTVVALDAAADDAPARLLATLDAAGVRFQHAVIGLGQWHDGDCLDVTAAELRDLLTTNVVAPHAWCRALIPRLEAGGGLLVIGSLAGIVALPGLSAYAASKASLHSLVLALRQEQRGRGVHVSLLAPGVVATEFIPRSERTRLRLLADAIASPPETVARAGYLGLMADRPMIVPGFLWRALWIGHHVVPSRLVAWMSRLAFRFLVASDTDAGPDIPGRAVRS